MASLMTHIGSGSVSEINASLTILADLVKSQLKEISRFAVIIKVWTKAVLFLSMVFWCHCYVFAAFETTKEKATRDPNITNEVFQALRHLCCSELDTLKKLLASLPEIYEITIQQKVFAHVLTVIEV